MATGRKGEKYPAASITEGWLVGSWKVGKVYVIANGQTDAIDHAVWDPFVSESASFCYYRLNVQNSFFKQRNLSVQSISHVWLFATPWTAVHQACLSITNSRSLIKLMSIESVMPSNHLILCLPLRLSSSVFPSIRIFSNESVLHSRWPKYWSFSFSISPSNEYSGLISFRMDWLDLFAVQGTLKSFSQHHSSKASILQLSASFIVQL